MKKYLALTLAIVMMLTLCACGGKTVTSTLYVESWESETDLLAVEFSYPDSADIVLEEDPEYPDTKSLIWEKKNMEIEFSLFEDTTFKDNKAYDAENQEDFKEFKIGNYDCYGYEAFGGYWIYVHLEEVSETTDRYLIITTETIDYSEDAPEGIAQYEDKDVKSIIESFNYLGMVEAPVEE